MTNELKHKVKTTGNGNPLILVPGGLTGWISWEPFAATFSEMNRKVVRVQLLNVEYAVENKKLPDDYSVKTESHALASAIKSLGYFQPLDIIAWSYGALVSLDYAINNPLKIRTLTLIEPPAVWTIRSNGTPDLNTQRILDFFMTLDSDINEDMLAAFLQEVGFTAPGESPRGHPMWNQWLPFRQSLRNSPAVVAHQDEFSHLKGLKSPVLLVKGTGSAPFLHNIIEKLSENLPDSHVIELPGGHAPHLVSRDRFISELKNFLK